MHNSFGYKLPQDLSMWVDFVESQLNKLHEKNASVRISNFAQTHTHKYKKIAELVKAMQTFEVSKIISDKLSKVGCLFSSWHSRATVCH